MARTHWRTGRTAWLARLERIASTPIRSVRRHVLLFIPEEKITQHVHIPLLSATFAAVGSRLLDPGRSTKLKPYPIPPKRNATPSMLPQEPTACLAGSSSLGGSTTCTACVSGTYSSVNRSIECTNCPAGMSCTDVSAEPVTCLNGTFSMLGEAICSDCDAGLYSNEGASSCLACPAGYSCLNPATSSPTLCAEGYSSNGGLVRV